jgi:hypothetical protein
MILHVKRKDLEVEKYDNCIEKSVQSRIYAFSWYLDIVADNWDVLVLDDYEAVMPIPWLRKYGIKHIAQPFFCQQLGVFSSHEISKEIQIRMIKSIPKIFFKISLNFNSANNILKENAILKSNFILKIENSFADNYKNYNKNRKRGLKKSEKNSLFVDTVKFDSLLVIAKKEKKYLKNFKYDRLIKLISFLKSKEKGFLLGVYNKEQQLLGGAFFIKGNHRITYLFSVMNEEGKRLNAATFLISYVLKEYSNKEYYLDFEGSMVAGVADFFRSFGAKTEQYCSLGKSYLTPFLKLVTK